MSFESPVQSKQGKEEEARQMLAEILRLVHRGVLIRRICKKRRGC